jgi:hypothetical protein
VKVLSVNGQPDTDSYGNVSAFITVEGVDGSVLLRKKAPFPQPGEDISDDYQVVERVGNSGKSYKKLERPQQPGGSGGNRGGSKDFKADPVKQAAIAMQAAHNTAIEYARLQNERGKLPESFTHEDLAGVADFFYRRTQVAMQGVGE